MGLLGNPSCNKLHLAQGLWEGLIGQHGDDKLPGRCHCTPGKRHLVICTNAAARNALVFQETWVPHAVFLEKSSCTALGGHRADVWPWHLCPEGGAGEPPLPDRQMAVKKL